MGNWLKDHCQWYRRLKGGRWARWTGFWEKERQITTGIDGKQIMGLRFKRGYRGIDIMEGNEVWNYDQILHWDDQYISDREDYTKK